MPPQAPCGVLLECRQARIHFGGFAGDDRRRADLLRQYLADEILEEYREMIATYLEDTGLGLAAQTVRAQEWEHDV